jgi:pantoate--beta-alanine ligase
MTFTVTSTLQAVQEGVAQARRGGQSIGFVPTMGALHEGHASLIRAARAECGLVVVSLFVNPTQFGPNEDLQRYPRPLEQDCQLCQREKADLVLVPEVDTIYPPGFATFVEVADLQEGMEGRSRPGHFRGVATVVLKLFNIVQPDLAYFGQKDGQQVRLIQKMVADLNIPVGIRVCPTVRAPDGLALSSRNQYLDPEQRRHAPVLYRALQEVQQRVENGEREALVLRRLLAERIAATPGAVLDYAEVVESDSLRPVERLQGQVMIALAVRFGTTRLLDNLLVQTSRSVE